MFDHVKPYWVLFVFLLLPSRAFLYIFTILIAIILLTVSGLSYAYGQLALVMLNYLLLACCTLVLFMLPGQLRQFLASRAFVLCGQSLYQAVSVAVLLLLLWALWAASVFAGFDNALTFFKVTAFLWFLASAIAVLCACVSNGYFAIAMVFILIGNIRPDGFGLAAWLNLLPDYSAVGFVFLVWCLWRWLGRRAARGGIVESGLWLGEKYPGGLSIGLFSDIALNGNRVGRLAKLILLSNRPFLSLALVMVALIFIWYAVAGGFHYYSEGKGFSTWLLESEDNGFYFTMLTIIAMTIYLVNAQNVVRNMRSVWLVFPGSRKQLWRDIEKIQWRIMLSVFFPFLLFGFSMLWFGIVSVAALVLVSLSVSVVSVTLNYWFFYTLGQDGLVIVLLNLIVMLTLIVVTLVLPVAPGNMTWNLVLLLTGLAGIALLLRRLAQNRWAVLDMTQMRTVRIF